MYCVLYTYMAGDIIVLYILIFAFLRFSLIQISSRFREKLLIFAGGPKYLNSHVLEGQNSTRL
jgi:hypothetical protein